MFQIILNSSLRTVFTFLLLLILVRLVGRKFLSQLTFYDFIIGVTIGSVAANLALGQERSPVAAASILVVLAVLAIIVDYSHIKSMFIQKLTNSEPVTLIKNGEIIEQNMRKLRFSINDLMMSLREKNVFNISDVEFALIEADGKISVLPKSQKQPLTPSDLKMATSYKGLTKDLIIDGIVMKENLQDAKLDNEWLLNQLGYHGVKEVKSVFYAGLDTAGSLYVSLKKRGSEKHGEYGIE